MVGVLVSFFCYNNISIVKLTDTKFCSVDEVTRFDCLYMPKIGFNTNPGGFIITECNDGHISVCRILDVTTHDAALVNWFPQLSTQHWMVPPITDSPLHHQTELYQSESISVISSNSIVDLAFCFTLERPLLKISTFMELAMRT
jgi:hypothetical protein